MPRSTDEYYQLWKADPVPDRLNDVVESLRPTIDFSLGSLGAAGDPVLRSKARVIAAESVHRYDPSSGASLPTWVSSQLRQLPRFKRKMESVIGAPERLQIDAWKIAQAEREFGDSFDRDPTAAEIADRTGLPLKRIEKVRRQLLSPGKEIEPDGDSALPEASFTDWDREAADMVYNESDTVDRKVMEMRMGYGGAEPVPFAEIAQRLKISPASLSRRSAKLSLKIHELSQALASL